MRIGFVGVGRIGASHAQGVRDHPAVAAARAGLPVFCEKPVAPDNLGTVRVRDEVERHSAPNQIGFMRGFVATGAKRGASFLADAGDVDQSAALLTLDDGTLATLQGSRDQRRRAGYDLTT